MCFLPTDANEVMNVTSQLENKMTAGYDDVALAIMKDTIKHIAHPLACIINCSMRTGIFPDKLKIARVCPIFKSGDRESVNNYRPISVLTNFSKIFEKIIYARLSSYLNKYDILYERQYGFRPGHSAHMALVDMYDSLSKAIDNKKISVGIFIDLSKAFDCINHEILIKKLEHYGIRGIVLQWFISYLSDRSQFISINNKKSSIKHLECGVPQGSVLGPLLFLIYINDIVNCSSILNFILFADDTSIYYSDCNLDVLNLVVNNELKMLDLWFKVNKLTLNVSKTNYILFSSKNKLYDASSVKIMLNNIPITQVTSTKFLGVFVDENLKWNIHINMIENKLARSIGILKKLSHKLSHHALKALYNSFIEPYLSYCNLIWGSNYSTNLYCLYVLQKNALRIVCNVRYNTHSKPLFVQLHKLNVYEIKKTHFAVFFISCIIMPLRLNISQICFHLMLL